MNIYKWRVQYIDTTDSIQSKDSFIDIGDDYSSGSGDDHDRKITIVHL